MRIYFNIAIALSFMNAYLFASENKCTHAYEIDNSTNYQLQSIEYPEINASCKKNFKDDGWYIGILGGGNFLRNCTTRNKFYYVKNKQKPGFIFGTAIGYKFTDIDNYNCTLEGEICYRQNYADATFRNYIFDCFYNQEYGFSYCKSLTYMLNFYSQIYTPPILKKYNLKPYVLLGCGMQSSISHKLSYKYTSVTYQFGFGLNYTFRNKLEASLGYKYLISKFRSNNQSVCLALRKFL